jgi:hypothetical protein
MMLGAKKSRTREGDRTKKRKNSQPLRDKDVSNTEPLRLVVFHREATKIYSLGFNPRL